MPTLMSIGKEVVHELLSARDALLEPVLPGVCYSLGTIEKDPVEMSDPAWSPYKGYGAYELLYDPSHGRVVAHGSRKDERDKDWAPVVELTAGRLFGPAITDALASEEKVDAIRKLVSAQSDSLSNLLPVPPSIAKDELGLAGSLPKIRAYYVQGDEAHDALAGDVVEWLYTFGSGMDGWDKFCQENLVSCGDFPDGMDAENLLLAWQRRADKIASRIKEKIIAVRAEYKEAGRPEGEWTPFTALTDLCVNDGAWCHIELFDAISDSLGTDAAVALLISAPNEFAQISDEYLELIEHGTCVSLDFDGIDGVGIMDVNERIEKAKDNDWRFDIEHVRTGGDSFWHWRLTGEHGDLQSVAEEYVRKGLYFPYDVDYEEYAHAHSFDGVLEAIWRDPEGFTISDENKAYYSEQELDVMNAFKEKLLARKTGEPDSSAFAWQVRTSRGVVDGDGDAADAGESGNGDFTREQ